MDLAARVGYDPAAGVTFWEKMMSASKGAPPQFLSTHPAGTTRIKDTQGKMAKVLLLYERAAKPTQRLGPPGGCGDGLTADSTQRHLFASGRLDAGYQAHLRSRSSRPVSNVLGAQSI